MTMSSPDETRLGICICALDALPLVIDTVTAEKRRMICKIINEMNSIEEKGLKITEDNLRFNLGMQKEKFSQVNRNYDYILN